jgi:endoglucanase
MADKDGFFDTLKSLSEAIGVSGYEDEVRDITIELFKRYADEVTVDALGNVIAVKRGSRGSAKVMVAAHMDEIGLMISHIGKEGFLSFQPVGGWNNLILPGQRVKILSSEGRKITGVIGHTPPHILKPEEAKQIPEMKDMFIDVGASSREDVEKMGIEIGSIAVIYRDVERLGNGDVVSGKAFDDRVGLATLIHTFWEVEGNEVDFYAVATVQEEVGLKGARTSAFKISPDVALALDVTIAADIPAVKEVEQISKLGKGPAIKVMDGRSGSGLITNPHIKKKLVEIARKENIPYQLEVLSGGTTDATIIALNKEGVPAGVVSIPTRYIHSPVEVLNLNDCVNAVRLTRRFVESVSLDWIELIKGAKVK